MAIIMSTSPEEKLRQQWVILLKRYGSYELERRIHRMESWRKYDSKYPYDVATKAVDIDVLYDLSNDEPSPHEQLVMKQARAEYLAILTPMQQDIAIELEKGKKPRDIANDQGKTDSGSIRWLKNAAKKRLQDYLSQ